MFAPVQQTGFEKNLNREQVAPDDWICWVLPVALLFGKPRRVTAEFGCHDKKRTRFRNLGGVKWIDPAQNTATMKLETMPVRSNPALLSIKKILVPVDFSSLSKKAFQYALRLAQQFKAELTLIHVLEPAVPPSFEGLQMAPPFREEDSSGAEKDLRALMTSARTAGVPKARSLFRRGLASHEIVDTAKDLDVDLIVIATHGYTGWKHFCIGSTAERVVRAAPCPVLVVREKEHEFI
jgi:universal stress protein A